MFCINCGQQLPDDAKFCFHCGKPCAAKAPQTPNQTPIQQVPPVPNPIPVQPLPPTPQDSVIQPAEPEKPKKRKLGLIIGISVGSLVLIILLLFLLIGDDDLYSVSYRGETFTYGDIIDRDEIERKFPNFEDVLNHHIALDDSLTLLLRRTEETDEEMLVGFMIQDPGISYGGLSVGDSLNRLFSQYPKAIETYEYIQEYYSVSTYGTFEITLYLSNDELLSRQDEFELQQEYAVQGLISEFYTLLEDEFLMISFKIKDEKIEAIFVGDYRALTQLS